jgi:hypothetical protein
MVAWCSQTPNNFAKMKPRIASHIGGLAQAACTPILAHHGSARLCSAIRDDISLTIFDSAVIARDPRID